MSVGPYPEYQESGVEWLGHVPVGWRVVRIADLFREVIEDGEDALPVLSVSIHDGVSDRELADAELDRKVSKSEDRTKYKRVEPGDLVYNMMRAWQGGFGTVGVLGMVSPAYVVARPKVEFRTDYIELVLRTSGAVEEMRRFSRGVTDFRLRLYWDEFKTIKVPLPSAGDQNLIATFLDRETGKLDALVAEQERLIALLKEKRKAVISQAVTKGLHPNVAMKDSGVEWLGEVPAHWQVMALRYFANVGNGSTPSRENEDYWRGGIYPWLTSTHVNRDFIDCASEFVSDVAMKECHLPRIAPPAVLIGITGQGRTRAMVSTLTIEATISQHIAFIKPNNEYIRVAFLRRIFEHIYDWLRLESEGGGSTKGAITCEQLMKIRIPIPTFEEQEAIEWFIDREMARTDALQFEAARAIALLKERRAALISAAVTGKIDVRSLAPETQAAA